jgi:hypothetical protein
MQCEIVENVCNKVVVETPMKVFREYVTTHDNPEVCFVTGR